MNIRNAFRSVLILIATAVVMGLAACGSTTPGTPSTASSASSPATSHFKADLTLAYTSVQAIRVTVTSATNAKLLKSDAAQLAQNQCKAFTKTLDSLAKDGDSVASGDTLSATLAAIDALNVFVTAQQGVPK